MKPTLQTQAPTSTDKLLREKFDEEIPQQSERMEELAKLLVTIELALPAIYTTALKLSYGRAAVTAQTTTAFTPSCALYAAFFLWFIALACSLTALFPRQYRVDRDIVRHAEEPSPNKALSIEAYFRQSARYKWRWVLVSCVSCFVGTISAVASILL